jgi:DnaJ family protein C protein 22
LNARGLVQFKSAGHRGAVPCEFKSVPFVCIDETTKQCEIPKPTKEENRKAMEDDKTKSTLVVKSKEGETISTSDKESTEVEREENSKAMEDDKTKSAKSEEKPKKGGEKDPTSPTKDKEEETQQIGETSKLFAYLLWFFLGWAGIHHFYLRRYRQGVLWLTSFGGLFGIGLLGDIVRLPTYVHYSNKNKFVERLEQKKKYSKGGPPVSDNLHRIVSQVMFGVFYRGLIYCAIPWDSPVMNYAAIILPLGTAFGTYMVSNVGRQQSSFWWSLLGAYMGELFGAYIGVNFDACIDEFFGAYIGEHFAGVLPSSKPLSAAAFSMMLSTYGWKWRNEKDNPSFRMCLLTVFMAYLILFCLCGSYVNNNAAFLTADGDSIKVPFALDSSLNSPAWQDIKRGLWDLPEIIQQEWKTEAVWGILVNIINTVMEEYHAYNTLGLEPGAEFEEVRKKYKELAAKWHPDLHRGEKMKLKATEKFQQYANAYQLLKESHKRRNNY